MSLKSKLRIKNAAMFAAFGFYVFLGIICFIVLTTVDFRLIHIGIIGILSLVTAYGLFRSRVWTIWVVVPLAFVVTSFSIYMLYSVLGLNLLLDAIMIVLLLLTWVFTAYISANRKSLEN